MKGAALGLEDHPRSRGVYRIPAGAGYRGRGSSPLARGLQMSLRRPDLLHRIIPARAGFTGTAIRGRTAPGDHPRSRGVYRLRQRGDPRRRGSSPLARGLPRRAVAALDAAGIIPARAGFTDGRRRRRPWRADHPRSRGVYLDTIISAGVRGGIIPARAGFTHRDPAQRTWRQDHPRSRGVYSSGPSADPGPSGSSPLARGLRPGLPRRAPHPGIIPARAGFTSYSPRPAWMVGDHPRSRGVYCCCAKSAGSKRGSSPLARGLLGPGRWRGRGARIIPARAGFTTSRWPGCASAWDHPRSRGVYARALGFSTGSSGSSPLARGLPQSASAPGKRRGIIPARAGFTRRRRRRRRGGRDHPRSRGVYSAASRAARSAAGSSPLARGLLPLRPPISRPGGIIPARAGFTRRRLAPGDHRADHPRSRGVYSSSPAESPPASGSSPLARGLRGRRIAPRAVPRIIPARAGFTALSPPPGRP